MTKTKLTFSLSKCWKVIQAATMAVVMTATAQAQVTLSCAGEINTSLFPHGAIVAPPAGFPAVPICSNVLTPLDLLTPGSDIAAILGAYGGTNAVVQRLNLNTWVPALPAPAAITPFALSATYPFGFLPSAVLTTADVGRRIQMRVAIVRANGTIAATCWSWVNVEEKSNPVLKCPDPIVVNCLKSTDPSVTGTIKLADGTASTATVTDDLLAIPPGAPVTEAFLPANVTGLAGNGWYYDCSSATTTYTDATAETSCTTPYTIAGTAGELSLAERTRLGISDADYNNIVTTLGTGNVIKIIARKFKVTDAHGNYSECTQFIGVKRLDLTMTIIRPFDETLSCHQNITDFSPSAIDARGLLPGHSWTAFPIMFIPKTGVIPVPVCPTTIAAANALLATYDTIQIKPGNNTCGVSVTYIDNDLILCAGSFKKLRRWRLLNWCGARFNICPVPTNAADNPALTTLSTVELGEQVIKYLDLTPPTVSAFYTDYITTSSYLCTRDAAGAVIAEGAAGAITKQDVTARQTTKAFTDYLVEFGKNGVVGDVRATSGVLVHTITALGDAQRCGGNVTITLKATDAGCVTPGSQVTMTSSDNRLTVATGYPRYNATTGETEYRFTGYFDVAATPYRVTFTVADACGYAKAVQNFDINVIDNAKPQPICIEYLQLALGTDGKARLQAENLNRASTDNCTNQRNLRYLVRRMTEHNADGTTQVNNTDDCYKQFVEFDCFDAWSTNNALNNTATATTLGIVMRVCDEYGNYNDCMVQVLIEDKVRPTCVPPTPIGPFGDNVIKCNAYSNLWNTAQYGDATYYDNCTATIEELPTIFNLNNCRQGTITRKWKATDKFGNTNLGTCEQVITVKSISDFTVDFPDDYVANCYGVIPTAEEAKNAMLTNARTVDGHIENNGCGILAVEVSDRNLSANPDGSCFKVLRKYRVIDWCKFNPNNSNENFNSYGKPVAGDVHSNTIWDNDFTGNLPAWENLANRGNAQERKFRDADDLDGSADSPYRADQPIGSQYAYSDGVICYTQIIKLIDNVAPTVTETADALETCDYGSASNCAARYEKTLEATDQCQGGVSTEGLTFHWTIARKYAPNTIVDSGSTNHILIASLPYDTIYIVKWTAEDKCGNSGHDEYLVQFRDCKKPSIVCAVVNAEIMPLTGNPAGGGAIEIWARELFISVADNCTDRYTLERKVRVRKAGTGTGYPATGSGVTFTCDDYNANATHTAQVEVWTQDNAGNADFCLSTVTLQNNMGACGGTDERRAVVSGGVQTETRSNIENVAVKVSANGVAAGAFTTRADGAFSIGGLSMGQNYAVRGEKTDNLLNGVTTYDIALISRHILGTEVLNSPYKIIAADVNNDRDVNTADMINLRRLILHITSALPNNNPSWRFVNSAYTFRSAANPLGEDFPEVVNATNAARTNTANFVGIKVGDLNGSAIANGFESLGIRGAAGTLVLKTDDLNLVAGKTYTVKLNATEFKVVGMQGTFNFAKGYVDQISVTGQLPNMGEGNFGLFDNAVTASWNGKAAAETDVLTLTFRAKQNAKLSEILTVGSNLTYAEGYDAAGESFSVNLQFNNGKVTGNEFTLYQNEPNPFDGTTKIGFSLPEAANATLTVYDATGRVLSVKEGSYSTGYNAINISKADVNANGVLYYRLDSGNNTATKKMIIIE